MARRRPRTLASKADVPALDRHSPKLNLACGRDIRPRSEGWTNMDVTPLPGVDVVHNALTLPWPFKDNAFGHVLVSHYLEHIPHDLHNGRHTDGFLQVLEEIQRVLRPGGTLEVFVPHWESDWTWRDPTHTRAVHPANFEYVHPDGRFDYYSAARFRVLIRQVTQRGPPMPTRFPLGPSQHGLTEHLMMRLPWLMRLVKPLLPPVEMHYVLECIKEVP